MNKIYSMIGLATRAGKTVSGEFSVEKAVKARKAKLVIVSEEAADNTKKLFRNKCDFYKIPVFVFGTKQDLGKASGNQMRTSVAITDEGFSKTIIKMLEDNE
jgi:ribosomal protein L7Ae-like RNA K-turn-binding protein